MVNPLINDLMLLSLLTFDGSSMKRKQRTPIESHFKNCFFLLIPGKQFPPNSINRTSGLRRHFHFFPGWSSSH